MLCCFFFQTQHRYLHKTHLFKYMYANFLKKKKSEKLIWNERATLTYTTHYYIKINKIIYKLSLNCSFIWLMNFNTDMRATLILWSRVSWMLWINDKRQNKGRQIIVFETTGLWIILWWKLSFISMIFLSFFVVKCVMCAL